MKTRTEKLFILFSMLSGFLIAAEYGITRPASQSLFLSVFSAQSLPWVWLFTVPFNLALVTLYNRLLPRIGPAKMFTFIALLIIGINSLSAFLIPLFPGMVFLQFAWKDLYILFSFKQLWSMIHSTTTLGKAKYLYGVIFGMGTLGSILGSFIPSFFATSIGSEQILFFTLPIYALLMWTHRQACLRSQLLTNTAFGEALTQNVKPSEAFHLIRRNRFLGGILLLVILMQASVGLMEYKFNFHLETHILDKDLRTAYAGQMMGFTNLLSGMFQILGGFLMVRVFGLKGSHLFIPCLLLGNHLLSFFYPSFMMISFCYIFLKATDFSLFGVAREMLYIPLKLDEKFRAKAIIDIFAHRTSKAILSCALLALQWIAGAYLPHLVSYMAAGLFILWIVIAYRMFAARGPIAQSASG